MKELTAWLAAHTPLDSQLNSFVELFAVERMRLLKCSTAAEYVARLERDPQEAKSLFHHLAPPETWLFRYAAAFEALRGELMKCDRSRVIEVASLGCATGSEPYSIAATALSCGLTCELIRILALDYSAEHLEMARAGRASAVAQRTPLPSWATPWFHPTSQGQLQLDPRGLEMIEFRQADLSIWKPDRAFDFVFCRNVAIYLNSSTKKSLGALLCSMVRPQGLIFLGHADSAILNGTAARRVEIDNAFIFAKSQAPKESRTPPVIASPMAPARPSSRSVKSVAAKPIEPPAPVADLLAQAQAAADAGDLPEAEKALLAHLKHHPGETQAHLLHGCVLMARNRHAEAERCFTKVVYLDPANSLGLLSLAAIADLRGDAKSAERFRDRAARNAVEPHREP
ncbi:MAG: hypothetical protein K8R92_03675 [Planctomycetes bacterium]|nr:hypothetical protein [Planctomycetota bacterium]